MSDSLSIAQCAQIARQAAPQVRVAAMELVAARFDSAAAARNRRATLGFFGRVTVAPQGFYDPAFTNLGEYEIKAGVALPLFDGGTAARARARASNNAAQASFEADRSAREAGLRAASLAIEILRLRDKEKSESLALAWLGDLAGILESRMRGGFGGPSDQMRVALEQDGVQTSLESTRTDLMLARRALAQMLGQRAGSMPWVRTPRAEEDRGPSPEDSLRLIARITRLPEMRIFEALRAQSILDLSDAEHQNALRVDFSADAGLAGTDLTRAVPPDVTALDPSASFVDRLGRDLGASFTVGVERPIIQPTLASTLDARRAGVRAADLQLTYEGDTQFRAALDLLDRWGSALRRVQAAQGMVDRAETNLLRVKSLYVAGATGLLDVLDARRLLDDARERLIDGHAENRMARTEAETEP